MAVLSSLILVQQFAINQFLSLDSQVLAVSLQEEIRKEQQFHQEQQQSLQVPQQQPFAPNPRQSQQQPQPSIADQLALRQQQEALQQIIDLQNSINFPNSK